jgi:hypothetical protein
MGLHLRPGRTKQRNAVLELRGYADAAFANMEDGKSQYCFGFDLVDSTDTTINTGMFFTKVATCPGASLSSTDAELTGIMEVSKTTLFLRSVLNELGQSQLQPTTIYNDNKSSITLATSYSGNHKRIRYILPKITWLGEQVNGQAIRLVHMSTDILPQDVGTKALGGPAHHLKTKLLMGHD